jgi:hypothetical protein
MEKMGTESKSKRKAFLKAIGLQRAQRQALARETQDVL